MLLSKTEVVRIVSAFDPRDDGAAAKSKDLVLMLLENTAEPFSSRQHCPGHITCTALIFHPREPRTLSIHHHRLKRWLLPGGHVEETDPSLDAVAAREAQEETEVELDPKFTSFLAGIDVHGIPPKNDSPFHLHHDLIWCFRALSDKVAPTAEAPQVRWIDESDWDRLDLTPSIRRTTQRASKSLNLK